MAVRQYIVFRLNGEDFGIEITRVNEIKKMMEIFKVPDTPAYIEGLINLRGKVFTVFNLRKRFNLPEKEFDGETKIVIVNANSTTFGFIVDEVSEILKVEDEDIESAPQILTSLSSKFVSGVAKTQEKIVLLLDMEKVLTLKPEEIKV